MADTFQTAGSTESRGRMRLQSIRPLRKREFVHGMPPFPLHNSPFAQKEKEKFTKKRKTGCVLVQNVVSYKGVQK